jgi:predicted AlkP superfamily pyrophosphatase or phosphodiesterase
MRKAPAMRWTTPFAAAALAALLQACATAPIAPPAPPPPPAVATASEEARAPVTILVSIDGFRSDYLQRGVTPVLSGLASGGVTGVMHPSFPSKTFPNHWTLVTGMYPDHHGIVANRMEVPGRKDVFTMSNDDPWWWNASPPIWVDAEKAGIRTATLFWPGSNVAWGATKASEWPYELKGGARPSDWVQFNGAVSDVQRVNGVLDFLRRPAAIRPKFLTLYFDEVDTAGHRFGPDGRETIEAVAAVDKSIGMLVDGLAQLGQPANLVIVADHGMAATSSSRVVALDKIVDPQTIHVVEDGPFASIVPAPGKEAQVLAALRTPHAHLQCWLKAEIPARFHYGTNPRIPPIFCLAETGWQVLETMPAKASNGGTHGYDNMSPEMNALFVANGPAFRSVVTLAPFPNTDVYPLLRDLIGLPPVTGKDGDDAPFRDVLRR